jgi:hypothetical protein
MASNTRTRAQAAGIQERKAAKKNKASLQASASSPRAREEEEEPLAIDDHVTRRHRSFSRCT